MAKYLLTFLAVAFVSLDVQAKGPCYVVKRDKRKLEGVKIFAKPNGDLLVQGDRSGKVKIPVKKANVLYAYTPKPTEVKNLEKAYAAGKLDYVLKNAPKAFETHKYLGWGDHIAYLQAMANIDRKKYAEAQMAVKKGEKHKTPFHEAELIRASVLSLLGMGNTDKAEPMLAKMMKVADDNTAAFAFNARAKILVKKGKKKEAVLEYLKTVLLFQPGTADRERKEAKKEVVALLNAMKDGRAKEIAKIE